MVSAVNAGKSKESNSAHLSKIWCVDLKAADRNLNVTTKNSNCTNYPTLLPSYGTNYRMLRYKRIQEYIIMDKFFATNKSGKKSRGNIYCQVLFTDKGFIYVVTMKSKSEVLQDV